LAALGFDAKWGVLSAADLGAPHQRDRIWIVAYSNGEWELQPQGGEQNQRGWFSYGSKQMAYADSWWVTEPDVGRVAHGVAARLDRLKAIGNGQVPAVAAAAFALLSQDSKLSQVEHANHSYQ
jgi:DNA (cytosine-5)-methyltransferase 1